VDCVAGCAFTKTFVGSFTSFLSNQQDPQLRVECAMSAVFWRALRLSAATAAAIALPAHAEVVSVNPDQARIMRLPPGAATIVIGNPMIADATLQGGNILVLTGKGYGSTNLLVLDRGGRVILDRTVQVETPKNADLVVVYRGTKRESYSCTPECAPRITLGDDLEFFDSTQGQIGKRVGGGPAPAAR
jgi:hypothetical protein